MNNDPGTHPILYKIGFNLYKINPKFFELGQEVLAIPNKVAQATNFKEKEDKKNFISSRVDSVVLEMTVICNLRCTMCWWWGEKGIVFDMIKNKDSMVTQELTTQELKNTIDQLITMGANNFYLSGGEPFIRKDTIDIIEYISSKGISVCTNNNGTIIDDATLERVAKCKTLTINFSLDGPEDVHDKIRGKGTYQKTLGTIRKLVALRGKNAYPAIKTNTTFSPWIVGRVDGLIKELQETGQDGIRLQHLWFTDNEHAEAHKEAIKQAFGIENDRGAFTHVISRPAPDYIERLADEIALIEKTKYKVPVFLHPRLPREKITKYYSDLEFSKTETCGAGWHNVLVKANGDLMFCPDEWMTKFNIGNVRQGPIKEMWNNDKAKLFRKELGARGLFPACKRCCAISS